MSRIIGTVLVILAVTFVSYLSNYGAGLFIHWPVMVFTFMAFTGALFLTCGARGIKILLKAFFEEHVKNLAEFEAVNKIAYRCCYSVGVLGFLIGLEFSVQDPSDPNIFAYEIAGAFMGVFYPLMIWILLLLPIHSQSLKIKLKTMPTEKKVDKVKESESTGLRNSLVYGFVLTALTIITYVYPEYMHNRYEEESKTWSHDEICVNLVEDEHILLFAPTLEFEENHARYAIMDSGLKPRVQSVLLSTSWGWSMTELSTKEGKEKLREKLLNAVRELLKKEKDKLGLTVTIKDLYFERFMMQ